MLRSRRLLVGAVAVEGRIGGLGTAPDLRSVARRRSRSSEPASCRDYLGRVWLWSTVALTLSALGTAVVLAPPASAAPVRGLGWLLVLGSSVHVASTGWLYTVGEVREHVRDHRGRYVWAPVGLIGASAITAALVTPSALAWLLLPYFAWQFFHFQKQNLGMAALAASSYGLSSLRKGERRLIMLAGLAGIVGLMTRPALLQLRVDPGFGALFWSAALVFAIAVAIGLGLLALRAPQDRPAEFCAVYVTSLVFSLPVFLFRSPYAAVGGMTIAHGLQYLLLLSLVAYGEGRGRPSATRLVTIVLLLNVAVIGGLLLAAASHLHNAPTTGRLLFGAYLGVVMAHFVVDAGLWRLRDAFPRRFLAARIPYLVPQGPVADRSSPGID